MMQCEVIAMCGRIAAWMTDAEMALLLSARRAGSETESDPKIQPRYNVGPAQDVQVIIQPAGEERTATHMRWGFTPVWAKGPRPPKLINIRSESASENSTNRFGMIAA